MRRKGFTRNPPVSPHFLLSLVRSRIVRIAVRIAVRIVVSLVSLIRLCTYDRGPAVHGVSFAFRLRSQSRHAHVSDSHFPSLLHISRVLLHSQHKAVLHRLIIHVQRWS